MARPAEQFAWGEVPRLVFLRGKKTVSFGYLGLIAWGEKKPGRDA